jgi:hypothetical protein
MQEGSILKAIRLIQLQACPKNVIKIVPKFLNRPPIPGLSYQLLTAAAQND